MGWIAGEVVFGVVGCVCSVVCGVWGVVCVVSGVWCGVCCVVCGVWCVAVVVVAEGAVAVGVDGLAEAAAMKLSWQRR